MLNRLHRDLEHSRGSRSLLLSVIHIVTRLFTLSLPNSFLTMIHRSMGESNIVVSTYTMYRHLKNSIALTHRDTDD